MLGNTVTAYPLRIAREPQTGSAPLHFA